jgi:hypothetical protein
VRQGGGPGSRRHPHSTQGAYEAVAARNKLSLSESGLSFIVASKAAIFNSARVHLRPEEITRWLHYRLWLLNLLARTGLTANPRQEPGSAAERAGVQAKCLALSKATPLDAWSGVPISEAELVLHAATTGHRVAVADAVSKEVRLLELPDYLERASKFIFVQREPMKQAAQQQFPKQYWIDRNLFRYTAVLTLRAEQGEHRRRPGLVTRSFIAKFCNKHHYALRDTQNINDSNSDSDGEEEDAGTSMPPVNAMGDEHVQDDNLGQEVLAAANEVAATPLRPMSAEEAREVAARWDGSAADSFTTSCENALRQWAAKVPAAVGATWLPTANAAPDGDGAGARNMCVPRALLVTGSSTG